MIITDKADVMGAHCLEAQLFELIVNKGCKYVSLVCRSLACH